MRITLSTRQAIPRQSTSLAGPWRQSYEHISCVTVGVARSRFLTAQYLQVPIIGQNVYSASPAWVTDPAPES